MHELRRAILAVLFIFAIGITLFSQHVGHSDEVQGAPRPAQGAPGTEANCTSINCSATGLIDLGLRNSAGGDSELHLIAAPERIYGRGHQFC